uniref:Uncharacterized protein n=1 Tax=Parascaris equorum TaxID=6256 RepID=A0A914RK05_PAREQ
MTILDVGGGFPGNDNASPSFTNVLQLQSTVSSISCRFFATAPFSLVTNVIGVKRVPAERISKTGTKRRIMRRLSVGEWLYYDHMGAYTRAAASMFNGFEKTRTYYFTDKDTWYFIAFPNVSCMKYI